MRRGALLVLALVAVTALIAAATAPIAQDDGSCGTMTIRECVEHYWVEPEFMLNADVKKWRIAVRVADWKDSDLCRDVKAAATEIFSKTTDYDAAASEPDVKVLAAKAKGQYDAQHMHADSGRGLGAVVFVNYFPEDMLWQKIQHEVAHHAGKGKAESKKAKAARNATRRRRRRTKRTTTITEAGAEVTPGARAERGYGFRRKRRKFANPPTKGSGPASGCRRITSKGATTPVPAAVARTFAGMSS